MGECKHIHKRFITVTDYRGYAEKIFSCIDCGMIITDFASEEEIQKYKNGSKVNFTTNLSDNDYTELEKR